MTARAGLAAVLVTAVVAAIYLLRRWQRPTYAEPPPHPWTEPDADVIGDVLDLVEKYRSVYGIHPRPDDDDGR